MADFTEQAAKNRFVPDEFAERVTSFKADLHFPEIKPPKNIESILASLNDQTSIRSLTSEALAEYAILLSSYSLYLTMQENRLAAYVNWCENNIKFIVGRELENAYGNYFTEKDLYLRSHLDATIKLSELKLMAQTKLDSIKYLSQKVQFIVELIKPLCYEKSRIGQMHK